MTFDAANLGAVFDNPVPVAVTKLDYYGRQVEVQAASGDTVALGQTAADTRKTWGLCQIPGRQQRRHRRGQDIRRVGGAAPAGQRS